MIAYIFFLFLVTAKAALLPAPFILALDLICRVAPEAEKPCGEIQRKYAVFVKELAKGNPVKDIIESILDSVGEVEVDFDVFGESFFNIQSLFMDFLDHQELIYRKLGWLPKSTSTAKEYREVELGLLKGLGDKKWAKRVQGSVLAAILKDRSRLVMEVVVFLEVLLLAANPVELKEIYKWQRSVLTTTSDVMSKILFRISGDLFDDNEWMERCETVIIPARPATSSYWSVDLLRTIFDNAGHLEHTRDMVQRQNLASVERGNTVFNYSKVPKTKSSLLAHFNTTNGISPTIMTILGSPFATIREPVDVAVYWMFLSQLYNDFLLLVYQKISVSVSQKPITSNVFTNQYLRTLNSVAQYKTGFASIFDRQLIATILSSLAVDFQRHSVILQCNDYVMLHKQQRATTAEEFLKQAQQELDLMEAVKSVESPSFKVNFERFWKQIAFLGTFGLSS